MAAAVGIAGFVLLASGAGVDSGPSAQALVRRLEARLDTVQDLTAHFEQSYRSGVLGREIVESGRVFIKRPGLMRWEYQKPEKKLFVADGHSYYFYVPADKQVIVQDQAGDKRAPALLLSEDRDILADYTAALEPPEDGLDRLRLVPREPDPDVESVSVSLDSALRIREILVRDLQGSETRYRFEEIEQNIGLQRALFRFDPPRGVEVITG
jgi:outer membrane lipoprotein carrier protein